MSDTLKFLPACTLTGNIIKDKIKVKNLPSGVKVAEFTLVTQRVWKDKEGNKKEDAPFYHNCVAFGKSAEIVEAAASAKGIIYSIDVSFKKESWEYEGKTYYKDVATAHYVKPYAFNKEEKVWELQVLAPAEEEIDASEERGDLPF